VTAARPFQGKTARHPNLESVCKFRATRRTHERRAVPSWVPGEGLVGSAFAPLRSVTGLPLLPRFLALARGGPPAPGGVRPEHLDGPRWPMAQAVGPERDVPGPQTMVAIGLKSQPATNHSFRAGPPPRLGCG